MRVEKVIYDGDPGHDDAMAIIMAAGDPHIDLLAVTTVAGNTTLENTIKNALMIMDLMKLDIPVVPGCAKPLLKKLQTAPMVHGQSGFEGPEHFVPLRQASKEHAADFLIRTFMESDGDINLVAAGPLTNIALAMTREPGICDKIKQIVFMGGGRYGNITGAAEFNFWVDPEAAKIVIDSKCKKIMFGWDLTEKAIVTPEAFTKISEIDSRLGRFVRDLIEFYALGPAKGTEILPTINDACCTAYLINPDIFETSDYFVDVVTTPGISYGMSVIDYYRMNTWDMSPQANVTVAEELNLDLFWEIMLNAIEVFD